MNENKARNSKQLKWAIPVGLGLVLVLGVGLLYRFTHPPLPPDIVQQSFTADIGSDTKVVVLIFTKGDILSISRKGVFKLL